MRWDEGPKILAFHSYIALFFFFFFGECSYITLVLLNRLICSFLYSAFFLDIFSFLLFLLNSQIKGMLKNVASGLFS